MHESIWYNGWNIVSPQFAWAAIINYLSPMRRYSFLENLWFYTLHGPGRFLKKSCSTWLLHLFFYSPSHYFLIRYSEFPLEARTIVTSFQLHFASEMIINGVILIHFFFYKTALSCNYECLFKTPWFIFLFSWTLVSLSLYVFDEWMMLSSDVLNRPGRIKITQWLSSSERQEGEIREKDSAGSASWDRHAPAKGLVLGNLQSQPLIIKILP